MPWFGYSGYKLAVIAASIALLAATWFLLTRTRIGLVMRATQYDRETAQAFAIPVDRVYAGVFALGAMLAAIAAVLIVPISQAHYLMGLDPLLLSFIVVIIGGLGSLRGTRDRRAGDRPRRRHHLGLLPADARQDDRHAAGRAGAGVPAAGPVRHGGEMNRRAAPRCWLLHAAVIALLAALQFVLPDYHHSVFARIMVLAVFAIGYNLLYGYAGLLSLGHAMFFAAGLYGAGLTMQHLGWGVPAGFSPALPPARCLR